MGRKVTEPGGKMTENRPRRAWRRALALAVQGVCLVFGGGTLAVFADTDTQVHDISVTPLPHQFVWGMQAVTVTIPSDEPEVAGSLDVTIAEEGLILTRLNTRRVGRLVMSALTDLNDDEAPELILALASGEGRQTAQVWSWSTEQHAFQRWELPDIALESPGRAGRFRVEDEVLYWSAEAMEKNADPLVYRYDPDDAGWERERRLLRWIGL